MQSFSHILHSDKSKAAGITDKMVTLFYLVGFQGRMSPTFVEEQKQIKER